MSESVRTQAAPCIRYLGASAGLIVESSVEHDQQVQTIQVVVEEQLLRAADRAAKQLKVNRSALFRDALRAYLRALETKRREDRDRRGYQRIPTADDEFSAWDTVAAWPDD